MGVIRRGVDVNITSLHAKESVNTPARHGINIYAGEGRSAITGKPLTPDESLTSALCAADWL